MLEVPKEPEDISEDVVQIMDNRRQFLYEHGFEKQYEIDD